MVHEEVKDTIHRLGSRWAMIVCTTNSGKMQRVCLVCGRISPTGDKKCPVPAYQPAWMGDVIPCDEFERQALDSETIVIRRDGAKQLALMMASLGGNPLHAAKVLRLSDQDREELKRLMRDNRWSVG